MNLDQIAWRVTGILVMLRSVWSNDRDDVFVLASWNQACLENGHSGMCPVARYINVSTALPVGLGLKPQRTCRDGHWDPTMDGAGDAVASESESYQICWQIFFALSLPGIALVQPLIDKV